MWEDFVSRQIKRTNRNTFVLGFVMLAILGTIIGFAWRDVYNHLFGPFPAQESDLSAISSPDAPKRYYLKVEGQKAFPTGMQEVDGDNHSRVRAEVVALAVGKRLLLVKTAKDTGQLKFSGALVPTPSEVEDQVRKFEVKYPQMKGAFLPYMLDAYGFGDRNTIILTIVTVFLIGLGFFFMGLSLFRQSRPERHPLLLKLGKYGLVHDVRMQIDSEMRSEGGGERFGPLHLTSNWVIQALAYKTDVMQVKDVVWAFQKVTKHYHNGIPTGKTYSAVVRDVKGQSMEIAGKETTVPQLMQTLQRRMPWALIGFSKELEALWTKQKPQFMSMMEQRRSKLAVATR